MTPAPGDLVILVRHRNDPDERYPNVWSGPRLDVLATHTKVVNALRKAQSTGHRRIFFQHSPGGRIIGAALVASMKGSGDTWSVTLTDWKTLDQPAAGRSYGSSWYWVGA